MSPTLRYAEAWTLRLTALMVGLALFARLFGGLAFAEPPAPGMVPICAGGEIVWIDLDEPEVSEGQELPSDPCPYLGLAMLPGWPAPGLIRPADAYRMVMRLGAGTVPSAHAINRPYRSRAPPAVG
ncbi:MAG: hypothetical protein AAF415_07510 [Pseudomonadota bacterium]